MIAGYEHLTGSGGAAHEVAQHPRSGRDAARLRAVCSQRGLIKGVREGGLQWGLATPAPVS